MQFDDTPAMPIAELRARARRWRMTVAKDAPLGLVVVDYLQLVKSPGRKEYNRQQEIADVSGGLKILAKETKCAVLALSQLNRSLESRADRRPIMSDLRESGAIEQDADLIAFLYRDEVYSKDECKPENIGIAELNIGKQRNGSTGMVRLAWQPQFTRFANLEERRFG